MAGLINGSLIVETVFSWPGLGKVLTGSVSRRDFPILQFGVIAYSFAVVGVNLVVDLLYAAVDLGVRVNRERRRRISVAGALDSRFLAPARLAAHAAAPSGVHRRVRSSSRLAATFRRVDPARPRGDGHPEQAPSALFLEGYDGEHLLGTDQLAATRWRARRMASA
ncbi:MAG: ABC transporter permease subunit [Betaproteobacteria bacterium]|nr:ABC transporter permease subunit [Betaproteobacteria bacterium]